MSPTSPQQVAVIEFGKRHDPTDFCPRQLVMDLLQGSNGETGVMDLGKIYYEKVAKAIQCLKRFE